MTTNRSWAGALFRILVLTTIVLVVPLVSNQFVAGEGWSLFDFVLVAAIIIGTGVMFEVAMRKPGSWVAAMIAAGIAALGGAAGVVGEADDAPGLVVIGMALIVTSIVIGVRAVRNGSKAAP